MRTTIGVGNPSPWSKKKIPSSKNPTKYANNENSSSTTVILSDKNGIDGSSVPADKGPGVDPTAGSQNGATSAATIASKASTAPSNRDTSNCIT
jgi:hypothetical protein